MSKKTFQTFIVFLFILSMIAPALPANAYSGYYTYRSTITGANVQQEDRHVYRIVDQKTDFSPDESVFGLTRIFNITNVDSFRFKHEIRGNGVYREFYSEIYQPHRNWWAEIYYWKDFGKFSAGDYEIKVYISVDNEANKHIDTRHFNVRTNYYGDYQPPYDYYQDGYYAQNYNYNWTHVGRNIKETGRYTYEIVNQASNFRTNEDVYILTKTTDIRGIDTFQIKYGVYLDGNRFYKKNEVPVLRPRGQKWEYNYSWGNLGKLPEGSHEIRTYIRINNGGYVLLNKKHISISMDGRPDSFYRPQPPHSPTYRYWPRQDRYDYKYDWTRADTRVSHVSGYEYSIDRPKSVFYTDEHVKVLTKISHISGIDRFRVKFKLYKGNTFKKEHIVSEQKPNYHYWEYNYSRHDFGRLPAGSYKIKIYISVDGSSYKYLDAKSITVKEKYRFAPRYYWQDSRYNRYNYEWTRTGSNISSAYYQPPHYYPYY